MNKNFKLSKEQEFKCLELLRSLEVEIKDIEYKLKHPQKAVIKQFLLLKHKILLCKLRYSIPFISYYSAIAVTTLVTMMSLDSNPFATDIVNQELNLKEEFDSLGNVQLIERYDDFAGSNKNILSYYDKWQIIGDNIYLQDVYTYNISKLSREEIEELFKVTKVELNDILGEPLIYDSIKISPMNDDLLIDDAYMKAIIYSKDKTKVKKSSQSNLKMIIDIIIYINIVGIMAPNISKNLVSKFQYNYEERREKKLLEIEKQYPKIDFIELCKILNIKKETYKRLTR